MDLDADCPVGSVDVHLDLGRAIGLVAGRVADRVRDQLTGEELGDRPQVVAESGARSTDPTARQPGGL
jgi:hypothetical protein